MLWVNASQVKNFLLSKFVWCILKVRWKKSGTKTKMVQKDPFRHSSVKTSSFQDECVQDICSHVGTCAAAKLWWLHRSAVKELNYCSAQIKEAASVPYSWCSCEKPWYTKSERIILVYREMRPSLFSIWFGKYQVWMEFKKCNHIDKLDIRLLASCSRTNI